VYLLYSLFLLNVEVSWVVLVVYLAITMGIPSIIMA
jgi:hypothetical protein